MNDPAKKLPPRPTPGKAPAHPALAFLAREATGAAAQSSSASRSDWRREATPGAADTGVPLLGSETAAPRLDSGFDGELPSVVSSFLSRREKRHACSFPGLIKILVPERSLTPISLPVRLVNFSGGGALIEVHSRQATIEDDPILSTRYFELKMAHSEVPILRGVVAWTDQSAKATRLGLKFHQPHPELERILSPEGSRGGQTVMAGAPPLPMPVLDPFAPTTLDPIILLHGEAQEGLEIVLRDHNGTEHTAPVRNGRFTIEMTLAEAGENCFMMFSRAGERKSRRLPVEIAYLSSTDLSSGRFDAHIEPHPQGGETLKIDFFGTSSQGESLLVQLAELLARCDSMALTCRVAAREGIDRPAFEQFKRQAQRLPVAEELNRDVMRLLEDVE
ncbi:MAG: PilZ domain-containing protein [Candidatus Sumerlaeia bacterium]|nr:PilZ domain-containing protein [Candidatus Sumerlaeia bacterium]